MTNRKAIAAVMESTNSKLTSGEYVRFEDLRNGDRFETLAGRGLGFAVKDCGWLATDILSNGSLASSSHKMLPATICIPAGR